MRKTAIILSIIMCIFLILLTIFNKEKEILKIVYVENLLEDDYGTVEVCMRRTDGKLVLLDIRKHTYEDNYRYVLKLYDHYRNALPLTYTSPLVASFEITKFMRTRDFINIELKTNYFVSGLDDFLTALMWSYQRMGIKAVDIKINNELFSLKENRIINLENEALSYYDNIVQVIYYIEGRDIVPVSYIHQEDKIDFLLNKVKSRIKNLDYVYEVEKGMLTIRFADPDYRLTKSICEMILLSINDLGLYDYITIVINNITVLNS